MLLRCKFALGINLVKPKTSTAILKLIISLRVPPKSIQQDLGPVLLSISCICGSRGIRCFCCRSGGGSRSKANSTLCMVGQERVPVRWGCPVAHDFKNTGEKRQQPRREKGKNQSKKRAEMPRIRLCPHHSQSPKLLNRIRLPNTVSTSEPNTVGPPF